MATPALKYYTRAMAQALKDAASAVPISHEMYHQLRARGWLKPDGRPTAAGLARLSGLTS